MMTDEEYTTRRAVEERAVRERQHRNRRIIAERLSWPARALDVCEGMDRLYPGWTAWWDDAHPGPSRWAHPARYSASRHDVSIEGGDPMRSDGIRRHPTVYGETVAELRAAIEAMQARIDAQEELDRRVTAWMLDRPR